MQYNLIVDDTFIGIVTDMADLALKARGLQVKQAIDLVLNVLETKTPKDE